MLGCVVPWVRRRWLAVIASLLAAAVILLLVVVFVQRLDARDGRRKDSFNVTNTLCDAVNETPAKIATFVAKTERLRQITGSPTTTVPLAGLTPEEAAEVSRLQAELAADFRALGKPVECYRRSP